MFQGHDIELLSEGVIFKCEVKSGFVSVGLRNLLPVNGNDGSGFCEFDKGNFETFGEGDIDAILR